VSTVRQDLTSDGSEFQVCGAATEEDRRELSSRFWDDQQRGVKVTKATGLVGLYVLLMPHLDLSGEFWLQCSISTSVSSQPTNYEAPYK